MSGHPRLVRRNATYYHRVAVPVDIKDTYPKSEETFSLKTKDDQVALRLVSRCSIWLVPIVIMITLAGFVWTYTHNLGL
nr:DUF6538 domain-containing protein [uncultured Cohaesibacter sp.]